MKNHLISCGKKFAFWKQPMLILLILSSFLANVSFAQPQISDIAPLTGPVGTTVTISGNNFDPSPSNNIVYFGAVRATVVTASVNTLNVTVPAGATYEPVTVTTNNRTAYFNYPFALIFSGSATINDSSFKMASQFTTDNLPLGVVLSDFDGDNKPDLAAVNYNSNSVRLFRNTSSIGTPSFESVTSLVTGNLPTSIAVGDIDGDGKPDIAVTNDVSFSIFLNTSTSGNISFSLKSDVAVPNARGNICLRDLEGDGKPDISISYVTSSTVSVYRNLSTTGTVSFAPPLSFTVANISDIITVTDLDGDNKPELCVPTLGVGVLSILRNTSTAGAISFAARSDYAMVSNPHTRGISVGDFDADGKLDLAITNSRLANFSIFRNTSTPGSISFAVRQDFATGSNPEGIASNDINGDGKIDLVVANTGSGTMSVFKNIGTVGAISFNPRIDDNTITAPNTIVIGDLDGDAEPDLVFSGTTNRMLVLKNMMNDPVITSFASTSGCIAAGSRIEVKGSKFTGTTGVSFDGVPASSFSVDSDNMITAVAASPASSNVLVTTVNGSVSFAHPSPSITGFTPSNPLPGSTFLITGKYLCGTTAVSVGGVAVSSFTVTSDTTISAVVPAATSGNLSITHPRGNASVPGFDNGPKINSISTYSSPVRSSIIITGTNFNSSTNGNRVFFGGIEAEVSAASSNSLTVVVPAGATDNFITVITNGLTSYSPRPFVVTFTGGINITEESFNPKFDLNSSTAPLSTATADFDADGKADIVVSNFNSGTVSVYKNTSRPGVIGAGSFTAGTSLSPLINPGRIATGDLNRDGKPDLIIVERGNGLSVYVNNTDNGVISFERVLQTQYDSTLSDVVIHDINMDGRPDLIKSSDYHDGFSVWLNSGADGNIAFGQKWSVTLPGVLSHLSISDIDSDGKPDFVGNDELNNAIVVKRNTSTNGVFSLASSLSFPIGAGPVDVATGDLDGDGKQDVAVTGYATSIVSVLRNTSVPGTVSFVAAVNFTTGAGPVDISIADIDGDGRQELITANETAGTMSILKNNSSSGSISFALHEEFASGLKPEQISVADLDADGKADILVANEQSNTISIFRNKVADAKVIPSGTSPVAGVIMQKLVIDPTVQMHNGNAYVQRHYDIEPEENPATSTATVILYFSQQEFDNYNAYPGHGLNLPVSPSDAVGKANLRVYQFHGFSTSSLPGTYNGGGVEINPDDLNIIWNPEAKWWEVTFDVNGFSGFFVGTAGASILPLQLIGFSGSNKDGKAELVWETSDEINVSHFELQRSSEGSVFATLGKINAFGYNRSNNKYQFLDNSGLVAICYYRLKIVDKDSSFAFSKVVSLGPIRSGSKLRVYPNPAVGMVILKHPSSEKAVIRIIDINGRVLQSIQVPRNKSETIINVTRYPTGLYQLVFIDGNTIEVQNLIIP